MIGNSGHGNAVSLPQNNQSSSMRDVTIARLIVGKRHSRVLTVGNINSDATGLDMRCDWFGAIEFPVLRQSAIEVKMAIDFH
jgi:hypothetical protein